MPDDTDYVQTGFTADRGVLHLEARYNYEDLRTGTVWAGYNFEMGHKVEVGITPMFGVAFGQTRGVAPGYRFWLAWRRLEVYTEGESASTPRIARIPSSTPGPR